MGNSANCCVRREDQAGPDAGLAPHAACRHDSWTSVPDAEEYLMFFECAETDEELQQAHLEGTRFRRTPSGGSSEASDRRSRFTPRKEPLRRVISDECSQAAVRPLSLVPEEASLCSSRGSSRPAFLPEPSAAAPGATAGTGETGTPLASPHQEQHEEKVPEVTQAVLDTWRERLDEGNLDEALARKLDEGFPELEEWTAPCTVRRMLRATNGEVHLAIPMLMRAIECRVREREMFQTMRCTPVCDIRVIGRDLQQRPTIYMCARNQTKPLRETIPQIFLAFEAASKLGKEDGQAVLVCDMQQFSARRNMDVSAFQELQRGFGTVYADRLNYILIVDFSLLAQSFWTLCKPLLTERTRRKINFVDEAKARAIVKERFGGPTTERILSAFDINRDPSTTQTERELHARRTAICDVPLGAVRCADEAG